jgi:phosphatidate phosphatase APP1
MFRSIWLAMSVTYCCFGCCTRAGADDDVSRIKSDEQVLFFPTIGHLSDDGRSWLIPIHGWIFEPEDSDRLRRAIVRKFFDGMQLDPGAQSAPIFRDRMRLFLVDNERGKRIQIQIAGQNHTLQASASDGHITDTLQLGADIVRQFAAGGGLRYQTTTNSSDSRRFAGLVYCLPPEGVTVISDIDDTIKVTEVLNKKQVLRNTFLREFRAVEGMSDVYRRWSKSGIHFHYVSASPWQLYPPLVEFMNQADFPAATISLKQIRLKDSTFLALFADPVKYKLSATRPIFAAFPRRRFVLVGDSGEKDPETYGAIARQHSSQILRIYIRDITGDKPGGERYRRAFSEIPAEKWQLFRDPIEIEDFQ